MTRSRRILGTFGYLLFLVICLEVVLQVFYYVTARDFLFARTGLPIWAADEWSGIGNKPGMAYRHRTNEFDTAIFTNEQGFRVPSAGITYSVDPPPAAKRVMLLGPSFAFGWGVDYEQTFGHVLETRLEASGWGGEPRVQVINAGVPSLGVGPQLNWFEHSGRRFRPDLVVQFVYGSMTVRDRTHSPHEVTREGYIVPAGSTWVDALRGHAKKSAVVFYGWMVTKRVQAMWLDPGAVDGGEVVGAGRSLELHDTFDLDDPTVIESLVVYRRLLEATRSAGAQVLVVYFPLSYVVHPDDMSRWSSRGVRNVEAQVAFDAAFCDHLASNEGIPCLDLTSALRRAAQQLDERLYYWLDVHWTEAGNRVAAMAVADYLTTPTAPTGSIPVEGSGLP
jgi:hypothetical protein